VLFRTRITLEKRVPKPKLLMSMSKTPTENCFKEQPMDQDSDCWASLGQLIKTHSSKFLRQVLKTDKSPKLPKSNGALRMIHDNHNLDA